MQTRSADLQAVLSEIVKLAVTSGSHEARISRLETDAHNWTNAVPSVPEPEERLGVIGRMLRSLSEIGHLLRLLYRVYKAFPWGLIILGIVALWRAAWPLLSRWVGL